MNIHGPWSTEDFEDMTWHDVHVHGFRFETFDPQNGCADLLLDIDYILEWRQAGGEFEFSVCPATLRFQQVFGLQFNLDYKSSAAGMCPFSLDGIQRVLLESSTGAQSYRWTLAVNWPNGELTFEAPGFVQTLTGVPRVVKQQFLASELRHNRPIA